MENMNLGWWGLMAVAVLIVGLFYRLRKRK